MTGKSEGPDPKFDIPPHVPQNLVRPFSFTDEPGMECCPFETTAKLHEGPRIFWNPADWRGGGAWVLTAAEDMRTVLSDPARFTSKGKAGIAALFGETWDLIPIELDPPRQLKYRALLTPILAPTVVNKLMPEVREYAVGLIEAVREKGECEFIEAFARPFPIGVFMDFMGMPREDFDKLVEMEYRLVHKFDIPTRLSGARDARDYLTAIAAKRRANPQNDMISKIVHSKVDGETLTDVEAVAILFVLFIGGLDTVAASLGFFFRHLAEHPQLQQELRDNPDKIENAVEELLRRFSVVNTNRKCTVDLELGGVRMKAGDRVTLSMALGSLDPRETECPMTVDFDRENVKHFSFQPGAHFCMGAYLARRELAIALREWLARVPLWKLKPDAPVLVHGGQFGVDRLELLWDSK